MVSDPINEDIVKYIADIDMIEGGFHPVVDASSVNLDAIVLRYKCSNPKCKHPYEAIAISGLEALANSRFEAILMVKARCRNKTKQHSCYRMPQGA